MNKLKVYIASPYTKGNQASNVRRQIDTGDILMKNGIYPFMPLLSHFFHYVHPKTYDEWIDYDLLWVETCDCVLRLTGKSEGADIEVKHAEQNNIPVFYSIDDLIEWKNGNYII